MTLEVAIPVAAALSVGAIYVGTRLGRMRDESAWEPCNDCSTPVRCGLGGCLYAPARPSCECSRPAQACSCDQSPMDWRER